jgi:hypothetical protein
MGAGNKKNAALFLEIWLDLAPWRNVKCRDEFSGSAPPLSADFSDFSHMTE